MEGKIESKEKPKFEIGRMGPHEFEAYDTASTEEEAITKYLKMIGSDPVSNPEEITIFESGVSGQRKDLLKKADPDGTILEKAQL